MSTLRMLSALFVVAVIAACGEVLPTDVQETAPPEVMLDEDDRGGWIGSDG